MTQCRLTLGLAAAVLVVASCRRVQDLRQVQAAVSQLVRPSDVSVTVNNGEYLSIGIVNSPLRTAPASEKQRTALEIATLAYTTYPSRSDLQVVSVTFVTHRTYFVILNYNHSEASDAFAFEPSDLSPPPAAVTEGWVPTEGAAQTNLYFVPVGDTVSSDVLNDLASHFQEKLRRPITLLARLSYDQATYDPRRSQIVADDVIAAVRTRYATLARDARTRMIAITPYDIYMKATADQWAFTFSLRNDDDRFAVVSYARMDPVSLGGRPNAELFRSRIRKMVAKDVGIMCYGLPLSDNPRSVLYGHIEGVSDLDRMSEYFDPK